MSMLPLWDLFDQPRPNRLADQQFGGVLTTGDFLAPFHVPRNMLRHQVPWYYRPWQSNAASQDAGSIVSLDKDKFHVNLDVQQFHPEEITVKVNDGNCVTIEGKHEEKEDEHGFIYRHFVRRYIVPKGHNMNHVESKLSSDGVLTITVPKEQSESLEHRKIQIIQTGQPSRAIKSAENGATSSEK